VSADEDAVERDVWPVTASRVAVALPPALTVKLELAVHPLPFQKSVWLVTVPSATELVMVYQNVEVPLVASTCPADPVALLESRSSPVRRSLAIVEDASDAVVAVKSVAVVVASVVRPLLVRVEVAVILPPVIVPPVNVVKKEVTPWMMDAMRPVVVVVALMVADPEDNEPLTIADEIVVVARVEVPVTARIPPTD
jgi:hypothetical protein